MSLNSSKLLNQHTWTTLQSLAFHVVMHTIDTASFGNEELILENDDMLLRVVLDRGQVFFDIASKLAPNSWMSGQALLKECHGKTDVSTSPNIQSFILFAEHLTLNYSLIAPSLDEHNYKQTLATIDNITLESNMERLGIVIE